MSDHGEAGYDGGDPRAHLHGEDCPETLALLAALFELKRADEVASIGFEATGHGAWVDWADQELVVVDGEGDRRHRPGLRRPRA